MEPKIVEQGERWRPVVGYEGLYEVSDLGHVRGIDRLIPYKGGHRARKRGKQILGVPDKKGYLHLVLCKEGRQKTFLVSQLVAIAFIPNPGDLRSVHHKDFDQSNNAAANLAWVTHQQNIQHSVIVGRYAKKLSSKIIVEIRTRHTNGESQASIARSLGVRYGTVHLIVKGHSWGHIQ
jgi:hypothetical protein